MRSLAVAAALLAAPAVARAQIVTRGFPFDEVTRTYALHGCGNAPFRVGAPASQAFCLDGAARLGYTDNAGSSRVYHITVDFTGARIAGFDGIFTDANYSGVDLGVQYRRPGEAAVTEGAYVYTYPDLTGSYTFGVPQVGPPDLDPNTFQLNGHAYAFLAYYPLDQSRDDRIRYGPNQLQFALTVTPTPEPATLALTLGGLAVLGAGAWRRRR